METTNLTMAHIDVAMDDASVLKYIQTLISQLKGVRSVEATIVPPASMSEADYHQKIEHSAKQFDTNQYVSMEACESGMDFINRMVCGK